MARAGGGCGRVSLPAPAPCHAASGPPPPTAALDNTPTFTLSPVSTQPYSALARVTTHPSSPTLRLHPSSSHIHIQRHFAIGHAPWPATPLSRGSSPKVTFPHFRRSLHCLGLPPPPPPTRKNRYLIVVTLRALVDLLFSIEIALFIMPKPVFLQLNGETVGNRC